MHMCPGWWHVVYAVGLCTLCVRRDYLLVCIPHAARIHNVCSMCEEGLLAVHVCSRVV